jgi:hypothetical protein
MSVLALALKRLELSQGTVPKGCPSGTAVEKAMLRRPDGTSLSAVPAGQVPDIGTAGTFGTGGTSGSNGTRGTSWTGDVSLSAPAAYQTRRCFVCGQPASFGFGVRLLEGREGWWTCAAHRPQGEGRA